jgi:hypothetical protein
VAIGLASSATLHSSPINAYGRQAEIARRLTPRASGGPPLALGTGGDIPRMLRPPTNSSTNLSEPLWFIRQMAGYDCQVVGNIEGYPDTLDCRRPADGTFSPQFARSRRRSRRRRHRGIRVSRGNCRGSGGRALASRTLTSHFYQHLVIPRMNLVCHPPMGGW